MPLEGWVETTFLTLIKLTSDPKGTATVRLYAPDPWVQQNVELFGRPLQTKEQALEGGGVFGEDVLIFDSDTYDEGIWVQFRTKLSGAYAINGVVTTSWGGPNNITIAGITIVGKPLEPGVLQPNGTVAGLGGNTNSATVQGSGRFSAGVIRIPDGPSRSFSLGYLGGGSPTIRGAVRTNFTDSAAAWTAYRPSTDSYVANGFGDTRSLGPGVWEIFAGIRFSGTPDPSDQQTENTGTNTSAAITFRGRLDGSPCGDVTMTEVMHAQVPNTVQPNNQETITITSDDFPSGVFVPITPNPTEKSINRLTSSCRWVTYNVNNNQTLTPAGGTVGINVNVQIAAADASSIIVSGEALLTGSIGGTRLTSGKRITQHTGIRFLNNQQGNCQAESQVNIFVDY